MNPLIKNSYSDASLGDAEIRHFVHDIVPQADIDHATKIFTYLIQKSIPSELAVELVRALRKRRST